MNKYTFIFEYNKGTYISQHVAINLEGAIDIWSRTSDIQVLSDNEREELINEVRNNNEAPVPIEGVDNVWCMFLKINKKSHLLNIVQTV